jgi:hypothetical protein
MCSSLRICFKALRSVFLLSCLISIITFYSYYIIENPTCLWSGANLYGVNKNNSIIKTNDCEFGSCNREICDIFKIPEVVTTSIQLKHAYYAPRKFNPVELLILYVIAVLVVVLIADTTEICQKYLKNNSKIDPEWKAYVEE